MPWRRFALGLGILPLLAGCGSSFSASAGSDGGASDSGSPGDGATDTSSLDSSDSGTGAETSPPPADAMPGDTGMSVKPGCPSMHPSVKEPCAPRLLACEYGLSNNPKCNTFYACGDKGWEVASTPSSTDCPPTALCDGTSYGDDTGPCLTKNLQCVYPGASGGVCVCNTNMGSEVLDWSCQPATTNCPSPRPLLGTSCEKGSADCDYEPCVGGVLIACVNGYWVSEPATCPL
jgi:hypothetical protein